MVILHFMKFLMFNIGVLMELTLTGGENNKTSGLTTGHNNTSTGDIIDIHLLNCHSERLDMKLD